MPERIEDTLLVVEPFKDRGVEYLAGDRVPLRHRRIRQLAVKEPGWFRMEYETAELDLAWLAKLESDFEARYEEIKARPRRGEGAPRARAAQGAQGPGRAAA
jgi:hypothetical protein